MSNETKTTPALTEGEIITAVQLIKNVSRLATALPVETAVALVNQLGREQTTTPILDPTLYLSTRGRTRLHEPYVRAFLDFRRALEKIVTEENEREATRERRDC